MKHQYHFYQFTHDLINHTAVKQSVNNVMVIFTRQSKSVNKLKAYYGEKTNKENKQHAAGKIDSANKGKSNYLKRIDH